MLRRLLAVGLSLTVQGGAVCAPFLHAHVDADHDDHHSTPVHAHFSSHASAHVVHDGVVLDHPDDSDAVYLQVFVAVEAPPFQAPAMPAAVFAPVLETVLAPRAPVLVSHGHDPPLVDALDSRPPPPFLS